MDILETIINVIQLVESAVELVLVIKHEWLHM